VPVPVEAKESTLCRSYEEVYFSCQLDKKAGKKIVSLCASGNIFPGNGYVQYRFGMPEAIELQYPELPLPPKNIFSISDIAAGNVSFTHVKFRSGAYDYVLYQGHPSGVYVVKGRRLVGNHVCQAGDYVSISPRAFRGIETVDPVDGIELVQGPQPSNHRRPLHGLHRVRCDLEGVQACRVVIDLAGQHQFVRAQVVDKALDTVAYR